ncbi:MAG: CooT family nickel-binding protein [Syntrophobacteria bacterium]
MCLSTVYRNTSGHREQVMGDVAHIKTKNGGFLLTGLMGEEKFVQGTIESMDFLDGTLVLNQDKPDFPGDPVDSTA